MPEPRTLTEAMDNLRAAWRDLIDKLERPFSSSIHAACRDLHVPVREAAARTYRWMMFVGGALFAFKAALLLYAMATGQFDWSAG